MKRGCLWNSFVMVGHVTTFLEMIRRAVRHVYYRFKSVRSKLNTDGEEWGIRRLYDQRPATNFSPQVLAMRPGDLAVLSVCDVGWKDLGEPHRVLSTLAGIGVSNRDGRLDSSKGKRVPKALSTLGHFRK